MRNLLWVLLLTSTFAPGQVSIPSIPSLTAEQWRQDLLYFVNEVTTKHRDPYHYTSRAEFDRAVTALRERIPSMQDYEVVVGLQSLAALIGDGHTFVDTSELYHRFPLEVFWFGDELRVVRAAPEYSQALGARESTKDCGLGFEDHSDALFVCDVPRYGVAQFHSRPPRSRFATSRRAGMSTLA